MSDGSDVVLLECRYDARFGTAEDGPVEWCESFPDRECNYLDNFCLSVSSNPSIKIAFGCTLFPCFSSS